MSKIDKLKNKLYRKPIPNDIRIDEVIRIAEYYGCQTKRGGKHPLKIIYVPFGTVIPIPCHGDIVAEAYIKELKDLIDEIESKEDEK